MRAQSTMGLAALALLFVAGSSFIERASAATPARCPFTSSDALAARTGATARRRHGEPALTPSQREAIEQKLAALDNEVAAQARKQLTYAVEIPVYFHVMVSTSGEGNVTRRQIIAQVDELNRNYNSPGPANATNIKFSFKLIQIDWYVNNAWHYAGLGSQAEATAKRRTRVGGFDVLNFWVANLGTRLLGWSSIAFSPVDLDGVWIHYNTLPGGDFKFYNLGRTATHEIGHWLGLWHVFQGGCAAPNDYVADTPPQLDVYGCDTKSDTCRGGPRDSISNYMQYTDDCCLTNFTPGQRKRMFSMWGYRILAQ